MRTRWVQLSAVAFGLAVSIMAADVVCAQGLTVAFGSSSVNDQSYDPRVTLARNEEQVIIHIFDQLIEADNDSKLYPGLAKSWDVAPDGLSVVLHLRDDVTFHDGSKFNADAVKFTFDSIKDPATGSMGAIDIIGPYEGADVLGPTEIRLRYTKPFPQMLYALADDKLSIVSPTAVAKLGNAGFGQAPVGTGPFRFVSWEKGREVVLERNPDYRWGPTFLPPGPSKVDRIVHRFIPNASTRVAALESNEIQVAEQVPPLDAKRLGDSGKFSALIGIAAGVPHGIGLNTSRGPLADIRVRQALIMSVNRPKLTRDLFFGLAKPAFGPMASSIPEYWSGVEKYYPYDPVAAGKLLDEAGWTMGADKFRHKGDQRLALYAPIFIEPDTAVAIQSDAKRVGFDITVEQVTRQKQDELMYSNGYDMLSQRWNYNDASVLEIPFLSKNIPSPGRYKFNWSRTDSPALDALLEKANATMNRDERTRLYDDAQKMITEMAAFMPIHEQIQPVVYSSKLSAPRFVRGNWQVRLSGVTAAP